ncbi:MAG: spermidine/putrescine ABC transporter substrate-binding protein PotF, partial [Paucibacter sp.]|nr:spermidine/putrescine ABC transporter substrate-binding protein PotF [Roseateles sp.]
MSERGRQGRAMRPFVSTLIGAWSLPLCLAGLAGLSLLASCSRQEAPAQRTLNIYNWSDYIGEDTVANFEKETGIKVHYDTFDSNEALHAKLVAGHSGYDIVVPSSNWAAIQTKGQLLQKIDHSRIANWSNIDPFVLQTTARIDPGNQYLAPWLWGVATVGINVDKVKPAL